MKSKKQFSSVVKKEWEKFLILSLTYAISYMTKIIRQKNKNNPTKPENQMKKEYLESFEELKKSIIRKQGKKNS